MGGYYVPNIQRPGFGYQRRSEDDDDEFDGSSEWGSDDTATAAPAMPAAASTTGGYSPLAPSPSAASTSAVPTPEYWPKGMDWMGSLGNSPAVQPDSSGSPSRGGAGTTPTSTETNVSQPTMAASAAPGAGIVPPPAPQYPFAQPAPPAATPSKVPPQVSHTEEEKLKEMLKKGPKRNILGTIAAAAAGFGVGYVNAAGRTKNPIPVPKQAMRDMTWRAPGGGAWDSKIARQKQLAEQEQGEEKRTLAAQQVEAQTEERRAQAEYYKKHGDYLGQTATTAAKAEADRQKQQELQRIIGMGGRTPQIRYFPAGEVPKDVAGSSDWYIRTDPGDPTYKIAVRPDPGQEIDDDTAEFLGLAKGSRVQPRDAVGAARAKVAAANMGQASTSRENEELRKRLADEERARHNRREEGISADLAADRADAREQRRIDAQNKALQGAEDSKKNLLIGAERWGDAERNRVRTSLGYISDAEEARIKKAVLAQKQAAYNSYAAASRQYGGAAYDVKVDENGDPIPITEGYMKGGKPVYLPGEAAPTPTTPAPAPAPAGAGRGAPAAPPTGGRGGRGGAAVPPPVNAGGPGVTETPSHPPAPPPAAVWKPLPPGVHTFRNGQRWRKEADGSSTYLGSN
jgi:hypothetical protein